MSALLVKTLLDVVKGLFFRVAWKIVFERSLTRLVCWGLTKLANLSTNTVDDALVEDIKMSLAGHKLPEAGDGFKTGAD